MKLCIPVASAEGLAAPLHADFGAARYLLIVDGDAIHAVDRERPEEISEAVVGGIEGILCGEIHPRLLFELQHNGIQVYGCEAATAADALAQFQAGELEATPPFSVPPEAGHAHGQGGCGCGGGGHHAHDHDAEHGHGHGGGGCCGGGGGGCGCGGH
ncbi:MAG: hypothetical protein REI09_14865 [Candidatus Dactylopiibacterium sp.]|nr:hypothetical protein [Candidatus Dactylopiibacterium sp.]